MVLVYPIATVLLIARLRPCRAAGSGSSHYIPWQESHDGAFHPPLNQLHRVHEPFGHPEVPSLLNTDSYTESHRRPYQYQQQIPFFEGYPIYGHQMGWQQPVTVHHTSSDPWTYKPRSHLHYNSMHHPHPHDPSYLSSYAASMQEYSERYPLAMGVTNVERPQHQIRTGIPRKRSIQPRRGASSIRGRAVSQSRSKAKDKMPTELDEEEEEHQDGGGGGEGEEGTLDLRDKAIPPEERMKRAVRSLWRRKGLWVGMPVKELVTGITEIKLELGWDNSHSIGLIAGVMIRLKHPGDAYLHQMQDQTRKVSKRIKKLNSKFDKDSASREADGSSGKREEKRREMLYLYCRFLRSREKYIQSFRDEYNDPSDETRIHREAHRAWGVLVFLGIVPASEANDKEREEKEERLPMRKIEQASRSIEFLLSPHSREDIADLLRFYMAKQLHQSPAQIDVFNSARNQWLKQMQQSMQQEGDV